jgi:hypothetical protein
MRNGVAVATLPCWALSLWLTLSQPVLSKKQFIAWRVSDNPSSFRSLNAAIKIFGSRLGKNAVVHGE